MSAAKRRKISDDEDYIEVVSPAVVSSSPAAAASSFAITEPVLDEIPRLVLVDLEKNDANLVLEALRRLAQLLEQKWGGYEESRKYAFSMGAPGVLVRTMRKWQMQQDIQLSSCLCLVHLCHSKDEVKQVIFQSGGIEAAVDILKTSPDNNHLHRTTCCLLRHVLFFFPTAAGLQCVRRFVDDLGGLSLVLKSMKRFPDDAWLQKSAISLFYILACLPTDDFCKKMLQANVVSAVATAMEDHLNNSEAKVKEVSDKFMKQMYSNN